MTAVIRASMEAGPNVRVKRGCAASAVQHQRKRRRHFVFRRRSLQSLHLLLTRLWAHMPLPPQSRQRRLMRLCSQMPAPPQSLQVLQEQKNGILMSLAVMLADAGAPAVLALAPLVIMLADDGAPAVLETQHDFRARATHC